MTDPTPIVVDLDGLLPTPIIRKRLVQDELTGEWYEIEERGVSYDLSHLPPLAAGQTVQLTRTETTRD